MASADTRTLFERYDVNKDGVISRDEAMALFDDFVGGAGTSSDGAGLEVRANTLDRHFEAADVDKNGVLDDAEFESFAAAIQGVAAAAGSVGCGPPRKLDRTASQSVLVDKEGKANMRVFQYPDQKLSVEEVYPLLRATVRDMGLSTDWVTHEWLAEIFRLRDIDGDATTLVAEEFEGFVGAIQDFIAHLGTLGVGADGDADADAKANAKAAASPSLGTPRGGEQRRGGACSGVCVVM